MDTETESGIPINRTDIFVSIAKGAAGLIPIAGSIVAEIISNVIPNQRLDRVVKFVEILDTKLQELDQEVVNARLSKPEYIDLLEDGLFQAARAVTDERKQHIAALIKNSVTEGEAQLVGNKHILGVLAEINDIELLILTSYGLNVQPQKQQEFYQLHQDVLAAPVAVIGSPQETLDHSTVHKNYKEHLTRLGLLHPKFKKPKKNDFPEFDEKTGMLKAGGYSITSLGRLLLRQVDAIIDGVGTDVSEENA